MGPSGSWDLRGVQGDCGDELGLERKVFTPNGAWFHTEIGQRCWLLGDSPIFRLQH